MSPLRMGSRSAPTVSAEALEGQARALGAALELSSYDLEPAGVDLATNLVEKVRDRTSIAGDHTVVALAGATGSGKSSLFNALVGAPVAKIGARRPTTSAPSAAIWGAEPAGGLLDWLKVPTRHYVDADRSEPTDSSPGPDDGQSRTTGVDASGGSADTAGAGGTAGSAPAGGRAIGSLDGLVLLDLPDFDSRVDAHRLEAERVLELVDVFVWITDPQKYADALLHEDHVQTLATHDAVTLVVLNQSDRLGPDAVSACRDDLRRLLAADGLVNAQVLVTSAATGAGIEELRQRLANAVAGANAARQRLSADIVSVAGRLRQGVGDAEVDLSGDVDARLVEALARAAGVPVVLGAVVEDYRRASAQIGGWLYTRWLTAFRADPLARLRLDKTLVKSPVQESEVRAVLGRSSIPPPSPAARAAVSLAIRDLADRAAAGLPVRWANVVSDAATPAQADLADALDQGVVRAPLRVQNPVWWTVMGVLQWLFGAASIVGLVWLVVLGVFGWLQLPPLPTPQLGPLAWPFVLLAGGLLGGLLAAAVTRSLGVVGARRRAHVVRGRLYAAIREVAEAHVLAPVQVALERHRRTRELLDQARLDQRS